MDQTFLRTLREVTSADGSLSRSISNTSQGLSAFKCGDSSPLSPGQLGTRNISKTPAKTLGSKSALNKSGSCVKDGDRFIANRMATDIEKGHYLLKHASSEGNENSEASLNYKTAVSESLHPGQSTSDKILTFNGKKAPLPESKCAAWKQTSNKCINQRVIPKAPEKVLDAPELMDDFYLNILDWSPENRLAIPLDKEVFIWDASSGDINCLMRAGFDGEYISSVLWSKELPHTICVGTSCGRVQIWDATCNSLIRTMNLPGRSGTSRVPTLAWREHLISAGSRWGDISHHDMRVQEHLIGVAELHSQEVCGLAWSPDGRYLASGGNDNLLAIWSPNEINKKTGGKADHELTDHKAAVKALAWCPWKPSLLSSGGGAADHYLRFWNVTAGTCVKAVDVGGQVSGLVWNAEHRELITSHGGSLHHLYIWKYPTIDKIGTLEQQSRILCLTASPNQELVACCSSDETIHVWHCFPTDPAKAKAKKEQQHSESVFSTSRMRCIR